MKKYYSPWPNSPSSTGEPRGTGMDPLAYRPSHNALPDEKARTFEESVQYWMEWTKENFPASGAHSSLIHLQEEIKEVLEAISSDDPHPIQDNGIPLMEYADCFICLLTAAGKSGFTLEQLRIAITNKMRINYKRKWKLNPDNTYSHIKEDPLQ